MKVIDNKSQSIIYLLTISTLLITAGVFFNQFLPFGSFFINYASALLTFLLALGFIGFYYRNNTLIFFNFAACIAVCSVMRALPNAASLAASNNDTEITVAHFVLEDSQALADFNTQQNAIKADFISVQTSDNPTLEQQLSATLSDKYPFKNKTTYQSGNTVYVFSAFKLSNFDTIVDPYDNSLSLVGSMFIDSAQKEIAFLSTPIAAVERNEDDQNMRLIGNFIKKELKNKAFLTLSNAQFVSNKKDFKNFQSTYSVKDSQPYNDGTTVNGRIFYSEDLVCTQYRKSCQGNCVIASYRFKKDNYLSQKELYAPGLFAGSAL